MITANDINYTCCNSYTDDSTSTQSVRPVGPPADNPGAPNQSGKAALLQYLWLQLLYETFADTAAVGGIIARR
ncbi:hypothetical protein ILYODFUR_012929 [Ilyodon furcidens]|uniref:Uncharacterized protein n=1 Tax=Ilyodon furcidens TaxID=33524 RepID=A0ABV0U6U2_9TELE